MDVPRPKTAAMTVMDTQQHSGFVFVFISSPNCCLCWVPAGSDSSQLPQTPILGGESPAAGAQLSQVSQYSPKLTFGWMWMSPRLPASDSGHGSSAVHWAHASISLPDLQPGKEHFPGKQLGIYHCIAAFCNPRRYFHVFSTALEVTALAGPIPAFPWWHFWDRWDGHFKQCPCHTPGWCWGVGAGQAEVERCSQKDLVAVVPAWHTPHILACADPPGQLSAPFPSTWAALWTIYLQALGALSLPKESSCLDFTPLSRSQQLLWFHQEGSRKPQSWTVWELPSQSPLLPCSPPSTQPHSP